MIISEQLLLGPSVEKRAGELTEMIRKDRVEKKGLWYAVTTGSRERNLLFILSNYELQNRYYWTDDRRVLALAGSWPEACRLVSTLVDEAQSAIRPDPGTGGPVSGREFRDYFDQR